MSGFTKLDSALTASSIWNEPDPVRIVWVTMLSLADKDGNVKGSVVGLAHLARKTLDETLDALATLEAPDPHSGRKEEDGRRVVPFEGGWHLVNHAFYREAGMSEDMKQYWREKKKKQRKSRNVPDSLGIPGLDLGMELEGIGEARGKGRCTQAEAEDFCESIGLPRSDGEAMFLHWEEKGWAKVKDWKLTIRKWKSFGYLPSQKGKNGPYKRGNAESSRNIGTANEGKSAQYKGVGRVR